MLGLFVGLALISLSCFFVPCSKLTLDTLSAFLSAFLSRSSIYFIFLEMSGSLPNSQVLNMYRDIAMISIPRSHSVLKPSLRLKAHAGILYESLEQMMV